MYNNNKAIFRTLKGPFLNFLIRKFEDLGQNINILDLNIASYIVQKHNKLTLFNYTEKLGGILPLNREIYTSFSSFYLGNIHRTYPPTEEERKELEETIDMNYLNDLLEVINYLHVNFIYRGEELVSIEDPTNDIPIPSVVIDRLRDIVGKYTIDLSKVKLKLGILPYNLNYVDILAYRYYKLTNNFNIDKRLMSNIINLLNKYYDTNIELNDKVIYYSNLNTRKIVNSKEMEEAIHADFTLLDYYTHIDMLLNIEAGILEHVSIYLDKLNKLL